VRNANFRLKKLHAANHFACILFSAVESLSESRISIRRLTEFFIIPELDDLEDMSTSQVVPGDNLNQDPPGPGHRAREKPKFDNEDKAENGIALQALLSPPMSFSPTASSQLLAAGPVASLSNGNDVTDLNSIRKDTPAASSTSASSASDAGAKMIEPPAAHGELDDGDGMVVEMENASLTWTRSGPTSAPPPSAERPAVDSAESAEIITLSNISLRICRGELVAVIGPVGSGKSSLAMGILGEMPLVKGKLVCKPRTRRTGISYAAQQGALMRKHLKLVFFVIWFNKPS
jgi:ABC-type multidrug transport system fused ATPase/permease subunit